MNKIYNNYKHSIDKSIDSDDEEKPTDVVKSYDNNIYFIGEINKKNILQLQLQIEKINTLDFDHINLYIHSQGGDIFAGLAAMDYIKINHIPVHTIICGIAASAAVDLALAGSRRFITENSCVLIHQLSACTEGTYEQLKDEMKNNEKLMEIGKRIIIKHTSFTEKQLDELLKRDLYLSAGECLKYNIVDEILIPSNSIRKCKQRKY